MKLQFLLFCLFNMALSDSNQNQSVKVPIDLEIDPNGYVIFCLCMGRFGNQADQFLGAMSFARSLNRTLVVPPFHTYKNIPYEEWFRLDALSSFHRVIAAEEFMRSIAPRIWPKEHRVGFCWRPIESLKEEKRPPENCRMKEGYPMKSFWSELGVDEFPQSVIFHIDWSEPEKWRTLYGPREYPVLAFRGAPGHFPVRRENRPNQRLGVH